MKVVGNARLKCENFNGVSDKLRKELIKKLKPNEIARFNLLNGSYEPSLGRVGFGASRSIALKDRIFDPYAVNEKGEEVGAYVEIGVPETIANNAVSRCKKYWVNSIATGIPGNGQFELMEGNIEDMETFEFLCLSNKSKDNKYRDTFREPEYEAVDAQKIIAGEREKDFKELSVKLARLAKDDPEKAAELSKYIPKKKDPVS